MYRITPCTRTVIRCTPVTPVMAMLCDKAGVMYLSKSIFLAFILTTILAEVFATEYYVGAEYVYDSIEVDDVDGISIGIPDADQLRDIYPSSYESGGLFLGYSFNPLWSLELGYANSRTERRRFDEQSVDLRNAISKVSFKSLRIGLQGRYTFREHSKISLIGGLGAMSSQIDASVNYELNLGCTTTPCGPFFETTKDTDRSLRFQYEMGAQYQPVESLAMRFLVKSIPNGFSFSPGTVYFWSLGAAYSF